MTRSFEGNELPGRALIRVALVGAALASMLGLLWWRAPPQAEGGKWRWFDIGQAGYSSPNISTALQFRHKAAGPDLDDLARLPGSIAYLPKKAQSLFGQEGPALDAAADLVLEPEKCLSVRKVHFTRRAADGSKVQVLLTLDNNRAGRALSGSLRSAMPSQCASGSYSPECQIDVWIEARPKKCA